MENEIVVETSAVLERVLARTAQDNTAKITEIATLEAYVAVLRARNEQLKAELENRK